MVVYFKLKRHKFSYTIFLCFFAVAVIVVVVAARCLLLLFSSSGLMNVVEATDKDSMYYRLANHFDFIYEILYSLDYRSKRLLTHIYCCDSVLHLRYMPLPCPLCVFSLSVCLSVSVCVSVFYENSYLFFAAAYISSSTQI